MHDDVGPTERSSRDGDEAKAGGREFMQGLKGGQLQPSASRDRVIDVEGDSDQSSTQAGFEFCERSHLGLSM
jgi:hypothetical protein